MFGEEVEEGMLGRKLRKEYWVRKSGRNVGGGSQEGMLGVRFWREHFFFPPFFFFFFSPPFISPSLSFS